MLVVDNRVDTYRTAGGAGVCFSCACDLRRRRRREITRELLVNGISNANRCVLDDDGRGWSGDGELGRDAVG